MRRVYVHGCILPVSGHRIPATFFPAQGMDQYVAFLLASCEVNGMGDMINLVVRPHGKRREEQ